ncbi:MAG: hypothetical protein QOJ95_652, partial [Mycobacterium sp.]|nr:hypothetical protein [Mycobacterium sp.]
DRLTFNIGESCDASATLNRVLTITPLSLRVSTIW